MSDVVIVHCQRCGVRCQVGGPGNPQARLLSLATEGMCLNCATTDWLKSNVGEVLDNQCCRNCGKYRYVPGPQPAHPGCRCDEPDFPTVPEMLRTPHIQKLFGELLAVGQSDAKLEQIDWLEVIANWELPMPKKRRKKRA